MALHALFCHSHTLLRGVKPKTVAMVATVFQSCLSVLPTVFQSRLSVSHTLLRGVKPAAHSWDKAVGLALDVRSGGHGGGEG